MQSRAFNFIISDAYRVELKTVGTFTRFLKEAGLLSTGARGVNAPQMTPLDAARVTIAILATDYPGRAVEMVKRFGSLPYRSDLSKGPHPEGFGIVEGASLEEVVTRLLVADPGDFVTAPYLEINQNARTAKIEYSGGVTGAFFRDAVRTPEQADADRTGLFGMRRTHGFASSELIKVQTWFYLERRDGMTWEERFRGCDEKGYPLDPAHPSNVGQKHLVTAGAIDGLVAPYVRNAAPLFEEGTDG